MSVLLLDQPIHELFASMNRRAAAMGRHLNSRVVGDNREMSRHAFSGEQFFDQIVGGAVKRKQDAHSAVFCFSRASRGVHCIEYNAEQRLAVLRGVCKPVQESQARSRQFPFGHSLAKHPDRVHQVVPIDQKGHGSCWKSFASEKEELVLPTLNNYNRLWKISETECFSEFNGV